MGAVFFLFRVFESGDAPTLPTGQPSSRTANNDMVSLQYECAYGPLGFPLEKSLSNNIHKRITDAHFFLAGQRVVPMVSSSSGHGHVLSSVKGKRIQ